MSRYQKGKTNLDFTEARDSEWHWHLLGHIQVCTSLQTDNHASTPPHTNTHPFNGPLSRTTRVSRYQKGKPIWILLKQETVSGSGICWAIYKSAPHSRQITTLAPHHSSFLQAGCPSCRPTNSVKALKAIGTEGKEALKA